MAVLDLRQRTGWLLVAVSVGHIVLISAQVNTSRGVPMLEQVVFGAFAEVQRAATTGVDGVKYVWKNYVALQAVRRDNERLQQEIGDLKVRLQSEQSLAAESRTLQELLDLRTEVPLSTTGARVVRSTVIGVGAAAEFRTVTIDKGTQDGLMNGMAVLATEGVVGRVIRPSPRAAKVQLLTDRDAAAGAIVLRSRAQGLVEGTGEDWLKMTYVPSSGDLVVGDVVVTSGIEGIYPKGLVIGQIESVGRGVGQFSRVRPRVRFATLEAVLVVLTRPVAVDDNDGP